MYANWLTLELIKQMEKVVKKLFGRYLFSIVEINDDDIDSVIVKLHEEISDGKGKVTRVEFIGYKIANNRQDYSDIALDIYYANREGSNENS